MKIDRIKELTVKLIKDNYKMNKLTYGLEFVKEFRYNKVFRVVYIKNYNEITIFIENKNTDMVISSKYYNLTKISDIDFIFLIDRI